MIGRTNAVDKKPTELENAKLDYATSGRSTGYNQNQPNAGGGSNTVYCTLSLSALIPDRRYCIGFSAIDTREGTQSVNLVANSANFKANSLAFKLINGGWYAYFVPLKASFNLQIQRYRYEARFGNEGSYLLV